MMFSKYTHKQICIKMDFRVKSIIYIHVFRIYLKVTYDTTLQRLQFRTLHKILPVSIVQPSRHVFILSERK